MHACMYILVVVLEVVAQSSRRGAWSPSACPAALNCTVLRGAPLRAHLTVHMPCCIGSALAAAWCAAPWHRCGMHNRDKWSQCGGVAPAWVMAEGARPMW